jgi:hypothetical protein
MKKKMPPLLVPGTDHFALVKLALDPDVKKYHKNVLAFILPSNRVEQMKMEIAPYGYVYAGTGPLSSWYTEMVGVFFRKVAMPMYSYEKTVDGSFQRVTIQT